MMIYKDKIRKLCLEQTELSDEDVETLIVKATKLLKNKYFQNNDIFIDVKNIYSDDAIVIFHKKPNEFSLYEGEVVGKTAAIENEPGVIRTLETGLPSIGFSAVSQEGLSIYQRVFPIFHKGNIIGTFIVESNSSDCFPGGFSSSKGEIGDECKILESVAINDKLSFMDYIDDAVLLFNEKGYLVYCNSTSQALYSDKLGYRDSILGMHYDNLILDSTMFNELKLSQSGKLKTIDLVSYSTYFFNLHKYLLSDNSLMVICKDITYEKRKELELKLAIDTVKETNHRVKNNLQTVISLLRLQVNQYESSEIKKVLQDSINRMFSISLVHEILVRETEGKILVDELLSRVIQNIQVCFSNGPSIDLECKLDNSLYLDVDKATAVALIVNELLQNSYSHAFKTKKNLKNAKISLQIDVQYDIIKLQISDNGSGYNIGKINGNHLGLVLVDSFVKSKLFGRMKVHSSSKGTITQISFKK